MALIKVSIRNIFFPIVFTIVLFIIFANSSYLSGEVKTTSLICFVNQDLTQCNANTCPTIQECIKHNEDQLSIDIKLLDKVYTKCENIYLEKPLILTIQSDEGIITTIQCEGEEYQDFGIHSLSTTDSLSITLENLIYDGQNGLSKGITINGKHRLKNTLLLNNVIVQGCESDGNGGGLNAMNFEVFIKNSQFDNNWSKNSTAQGHGGAIWTNEQVTVTQSKFLGNRADGSGGSISAPSVVIVDCQFESGKSLSGGAISAVVVSIQNSDFSKNQALESGGALEITASNISSYIYKTRFTQNTAYHGGHIFLLPSSINILKSEFKNGQAELGGAIFVQDKHYDGKYTYDLMDTVFDSNSAQSKGGAFYSIHVKAIYGGLFKNSKSKDTSIQSFPDYYLAHLNYAQVSHYQNCSTTPAILDKNFDQYLCLGLDDQFCKQNSLGAECNINRQIKNIQENLNNYQNNKFL